MSTTSTLARTATHPLDRLSAEEIELNHAILDGAGLIGASTRFPLVQLDEPAKADGGRLDPRHRLGPAGPLCPARARPRHRDRGPGVAGSARGACSSA